MNDKTWFDEETLNKVYEALAYDGLEPGQAFAIVNVLNNKGILFRERPHKEFKINRKLVKTFVVGVAVGAVLASGKVPKLSEL